MTANTNQSKSTATQKWIIRKLFFKMLDNWFWIIVILSIALMTAFLINRYSSKLYESQVTIVKGSEDSGSEGASFVYGSPYNMNRINADYEKAFITSLPVLKEVVKELDLNMVYYSQGRVRTYERYGNNPVKLLVDSMSTQLPLNLLISIVAEDEHTFKLSCENEHWSTLFSGQRFSFNQPSQAGAFSFILERSGRLEGTGTWSFELLSIEDMARRLQQSIQVDEIRRGYSSHGSFAMLQLGIVSSVPERDRILLERLTEEIRLRDVARKIERTGRTMDFIDRQLEMVTDTMKLAADRMRDLKLENKNLSTGSSLVFDRIASLEEEMSRLILVNRYFSYLDEYIRDASTEDVVVPSSFGVDNAILGGVVQQYIEQHLALKETAQLQLRSALYNKEILTMKQQLRELEAILLESIASSSKANVILMESYRQQIDGYFQSARSVLSEEIVFTDYLRLYSLNEKMFTLLMDKKAEAGINRASIVSDYRMLESPVTFGQPLKPQKRKNLMTALLLGLMLPVTFFLIRIIIRNTLMSLSELKELVTLPVVGVIGHAAGPRVFGNGNHTDVSENFRSLRSNLRFYSRDKKCVTILITSSISEEGKTFITANLGSVMALQGKKTLVVGADLRKPSLKNYFRTASRPGLSQYLAGQVELKELVHESEQENLYFTASGPVPPNPAELLSGDYMKSMLKDLENTFDVILIDTPPVGLISDAAELFPMTDGILLVTRQDKTPVNTLKYIDHFIDDESRRKTSILFNGVKIGAGYGYYSYGYGYGYGYGYYSNKSKKSGLNIFKKHSLKD